MKRRHSQRGSTLPEMAIAAGAALALILGIMDFGRALYTYGFVAQLAREGARWTIVRGSTSCANSNNKLDNCGQAVANIQSYIRGLSEGATTPSKITATAAPVSCPNGAAAAISPGCTVAVTVTYPFAFMLGYVPKAQINMSSTSTMVVAQ